MSTLEKIAFFQNRRDEVPNQLLAKELAESKNVKGIQEIAENLENKNKNVRSDCLKVLYEIGYLDPSMIAGHVDAFLKLLKSKDNRMVWGAMIGLATIADLRPKEIWAQIDDVIRVTETGTVITLVWGMRVLAKVSAADPAYEKKIFPSLLKQLQTCIPRDVPTHAESILCAVNKNNKKKLLAVLENRSGELTPAQMTRLKKVIKQIDAN
jgi:phage shock protein PspC (stress-responsive transcriptional regulator)